MVFKITPLMVLVTLMSIQSFGCTNNDQNEPIVTISQGRLKGAVRELNDGTKFYSFKGVPYAEAPTGQHRFMAPLPPKPWTGTREALQHGPVCTQYDTTVEQYVEGSEQCLFVNIYTKSLDNCAKIPVMVFIHGGGFLAGNGNEDYGFGPQILLQHDVLLVTINYRLELLGFLSLETNQVPGNAGMKDQVAALRWTKNNIEKFGGDPNRVTIFGESSGAGAVIYHMQSPMSKGLFHRVIAQSGVTMEDWAQGQDSKARAFRAGKVLGKDTNDVNELLGFLRSLPALNVTNLTVKTMTEDETNRDLPEQFLPVVEKKFLDVEPFITHDVNYAMVNKKLNAVPLMVGYNSEESIVMLSYFLSRVDIFNQNPQYLVPREISRKVSKEKTREFGERIKNYYTNNRNFTAERKLELAYFLSDRHFVYGTHRFSHYFYKMCPSVYMYRFSCDTDLNFVKQYSGSSDVKGASHADELFYIFYSPINMKAYDEQPRLRELTYRVTKLWADFAKTGNPTPDNSHGVTWEPYSPATKDFLDINERFTTGKYAEGERVDFWDKLFCEAGLPCINEK